MKWYLKVLQQYADFGGRARRKEFWYFVLFNFLLGTVAMIIDVAAGWDISPKHGSVMPNYGPYYMTCMVLMLLPGLAVAVRRLHDTGKSAWWILVSLIPLVGGIWLIVLMCTEGQSGENRYGANPKQVAQSFPEIRRKKSIAVAFIVGAAAVLIGIFSDWFNIHQIHGSWRFLSPHSWLSVLTTVMALLFGVCYYPKSDAAKTASRLRIALVLLAFVALIQTILSIGALFSPGVPYAILLSNLVGVLIYLSVLALALLLLLESEPEYVKIGAILLLVFAGIGILLRILHSFHYLGSIPYHMILYVAYILFAANYLLRKEEETVPQVTAAPSPLKRQAAVTETKSKQSVPAETANKMHINIEGFKIETDLTCKHCGQKSLSRNKFVSELGKLGLRINPQTNSITASGAFSGHAELDKLQRLSMKLENVSALKCTTCGNVYCLSCLVNYAPQHRTTGGKACFECGGAINYA
jgi:uncharacterized membrane protein YhaH (DUF805 family)